MEITSRGPQKTKMTSRGYFCACLFFRAARLQNEVGTKEFFRATNFLTKNGSKFSPKLLSLNFVGPKQSRKIPRRISLPKIQKRFTNELLQERQEF